MNCGPGASDRLQVSSAGTCQGMTAGVDIASASAEELTPASAARAQHEQLRIGLPSKGMAGLMAGRIALVS